MLERIRNHARPTRETSAGKPMPRGTRFPARGMGVPSMPEYVIELTSQNTKTRAADKRLGSSRSTRSFLETTAWLRERERAEARLPAQRFRSPQVQAAARSSDLDGCDPNESQK